jgi:hypothetical protein
MGSQFTFYASSVVESSVRLYLTRLSRVNFFPCCCQGRGLLPIDIISKNDVDYRQQEQPADGSISSVKVVSTSSACDLPNCPVTRGSWNTNQRGVAVIPFAKFTCQNPYKLPNFFRNNGNSRLESLRNSAGLFLLEGYAERTGFPIYSASTIRQRHDRIPPHARQLICPSQPFHRFCDEASHDIGSDSVCQPRRSTSQDNACAANFHSD